MTEEEKAFEWAYNYPKHAKYTNVDILEMLEDTYLTGLTEGRKEIKKENAELKAQNEELQFNLRSRNDLVEELTMQIEKMKCCGNCKKNNNCTFTSDCVYVCDKWELSE